MHNFSKILRLYVSQYIRRLEIVHHEGVPAESMANSVLKREVSSGASSWQFASAYSCSIANTSTLREPCETEAALKHSRMMLLSPLPVSDLSDLVSSLAHMHHYASFGVPRHTA